MVSAVASLPKGVFLSKDGDIIHQQSLHPVARVVVDGDDRQVNIANNT